MVEAGNNNLITIEHNGKTYTLSKLRNAVSKAMKDRVMKENVAYAKYVMTEFKDYPSKEREDTIKNIMKPVTSKDVEEYLKTGDGFSYYLYQLAKCNEPKLEYEEFADALTLENMALIGAAIEAEGKKMGNQKAGEETPA